MWQLPRVCLVLCEVLSSVTGDCGNNREEKGGYSLLFNGKFLDLYFLEQAKFLTRTILAVLTLELCTCLTCLNFNFLISMRDISLYGYIRYGQN